MDKAKSVGGKNYRIYISQSQDRKKNPLDYSTKLHFMRKMFPRHKTHIINSPARTAIEVAVELSKEGFTDIIFVAGSVRVTEFDTLLQKYNGVKARHGEYKFDSIKVISAGERDPDAEGASGMSASKMRAAAADDDFDKFKQGLPPKFASSADSKKLFRAVQKAMGVKGLNEWDEGFLGRTLKAKSYATAVGWYKKFIQRGDKPAVALHKAASMIKGLNDRDFHLYLQKNKVL
jgi:hypothetical protein